MNTQRKENQQYLGCINGVRYFGTMEEREGFKTLSNMVNRSLNTGKKSINRYVPPRKLERLDYSPRAFYH